MPGEIGLCERQFHLAYGNFASIKIPYEIAFDISKIFLNILNFFQKFCRNLIFWTNFFVEVQQYKVDFRSK